jgi:hypothetical protein
VICEELGDDDGAALVEGIDQGGAFGSVDEAEEVAGVIDAENLEPEAVGDEEIDEGEAERVALVFFEAPGEV